MTATWSANGVAVAGQDELDGHLARARAATPDRSTSACGRASGSARPAGGPRDQRVGGDVLDEVVGGEQDPAVGVPEHRVRRASGPGGAATSSSRSRNDRRSPSWSGRVTRRARAPGAEGARDRAQREDHVLGDPVAAHQRVGELVVELGVVGVALDVGREHVEGGDLGAGAAREHVEQPEVVDVLVGDDEQLEVLDRVPARGERPLELVQRLGRVGARVDERQRVVLDQVRVDAADRERRRDGEAVDPGVLARPSTRSRADEAEDLVARGAPCPPRRPATRG